jgi:hypothetical protein
MQRLRKISICLLSITSLLGLVRGYRMSNYLGDESVLYPYSSDTIRATVFSNYAILGWIVFSLIGLFSLLVIAAIVKKMRNFGYLIIVEGIFITFLTAIHILLTGFVVIHFFVIPICFAVIILGILQVPREF